MEQEELTPDWLALRHRLTFMLRQLRGGSSRLSDIRVAIYGPAALTALARRAGELRHALPKQSSTPSMPSRSTSSSRRIFRPDRRSRRSSACTSRQKAAAARSRFAGSLYAWAAEKFGK